MEKLNYNPFVNLVVRRINNNKNMIICVLGGTGSGKSYYALALGSLLANNLGTSFSIKGNLAFNFSDLLKKTMANENQKPGTVFLFEEVGSVGSGSSARQWQSQQNLFFNSFMQTSRHRRNILIMTTPHFGYLEKGSRILVHAKFEMVKIDYSKEISYAKPNLLQVNTTTGKIYAKYPRVIHNGVKYKLKLIEMKKPSKEILEEYEKEKTKFTTQLNQMIVDKSTPKEKIQPRVNTSMIVRLIEEGWKYVDIANKLGIHPTTIKYRLNKLKKLEKERENKDSSNEIDDTNIERTIETRST